MHPTFLGPEPRVGNMRNGGHVLLGRSTLPTRLLRMGPGSMLVRDVKLPLQSRRVLRFRVGDSLPYIQPASCQINDVGCGN